MKWGKKSNTIKPRRQPKKWKKLACIAEKLVSAWMMWKERWKKMLFEEMRRTKKREKTADAFTSLCRYEYTIEKHDTRWKSTLVNTSSITNDFKPHKIFIKCSVLKVRCQLLLSFHLILFTFGEFRVRIESICPPPPFAIPSSHHSFSHSRDRFTAFSLSVSRYLVMRW